MNKPNVIYILADDMGYGDFAAFNGGITHTPALDYLVENGIAFEECYSSSPVCAPARASILTGRYPQRTGVVDTLETRGLDRMKLSETTMADIFKKNGYDTALIGKWHVGSIGDEYHPNNRGFDYFFGFRGGWADYYDYNIQRNGTFLPCEGKYLTDVFTDDCVRYIEKHKQNPFFIHLAYNAPHFPHEAPQKIVEKYRATGKFSETVCMIYAMIECMDAGIGKILDTLSRCGMKDNTIVVFASDNGPEMESPGEYGNMPADSSVRFNCDLRGQKMLVYEGGIKVPAILCWPSVISNSFRCAEVVSHMDWLPTFMSLCHLSYEKELALDGMDISPVLSGEKLDERTLCWQWNRLSPRPEGNAAIRREGYKLIHPPIKEHLALERYDTALDEDIKAHPGLYREIVPLSLVQPDVDVPEKQLFYLPHDAGEKDDLILENPEKAQELEAAFSLWFAEVEKERTGK